MKFNDLYNRVFISEQDENTEVANPEDFNDVEPAPVPEAPVSVDSSVEQQPSTAADPAAVSDLDQYIVQLTDLSNKLVSDGGDNLLTLISKLNSSKPGDQFYNIYGSVDTLVTRASEALSDLASKLLVFKNVPR